MKVIKRSGSIEEVSFDKIIRRLRSLCEVEPKLDIDATDIAQQVIGEICDGIKTTELDEEAAKKCAYMVTIDPAYGELASRIIISNNQKSTSNSFSETVTLLYNNTDIHDKRVPLVSDGLYKIVMEHKHKLNDVIDYSRDFGFDYFAYKTLERAYLIKINGKISERIQHMIMRVSIGLHEKKILSGERSIKIALETYDLISQKCFTHATPTLFHAGTPFPQLLSCFLLGVDDSIQGIYKCLSDCAMISKWAGGIGVHINNVRAEGSCIRGTNGRSNGIVPMLKVFNETARYVDQCVMPETIIYTTEGPMEIQYCEAGNTQIFTTNGPETIENVLEHAYEGRVLKINTAHSHTSLMITPEHPVYCLRNQNKGMPYKTIRNRLQKGLAKPEWIDAKELTQDDMFIYTTPDYEQENDKLTEEDCYMYGLLLGDGCMNNKSTTCYISLNSTDKRDVIDFVKTYLTQRCILFFETEERNTTRIRWNKNTILPFRYTYLYNNSKQKYIHPTWLNLPLNKTNQIIRGLIHTDGCIRNEITFDSTSAYLINGLKYLLLRNGIPTGGYVRDRVGESHISKYGDTITNKQISYCIRIPRTETIAELLSIDAGKFHKFFRYENMIFSRISDISYSNYEGTLYDLQMTNTHDYMIENGTVHNGGGKRKGSIAIYLAPWHADIEDFLNLKKNHGKEEMIARDLFYALWIPDLFMNRVKANAQWSLFCPDQCPGLADTYGKEFEALYAKYEADGKARRQIPARDLFNKIVISQIETGVPYILFSDAANIKSNQKNLGMIKSSNLCSEILEYSDTKEYACCTLASICLPQCVTEKDFSNVEKVSIYTKDKCNYCKLAKMLCKQYNLKIEEINLTDKPEELAKAKEEISSYGGEFKTFPQIIVEFKDRKADEIYYVGGYSAFEEFTRPYFDFEKLTRITKVVTNNLNEVIDMNSYPVPETELSNKRHRPLGIGVQGLADTYAKMRYGFDSPEAMQLNKDMFAVMYYAAMQKSLEIAKTDGSYETFKGSPLSEGKFQFDLWDVEPVRTVGRNDQTYKYNNEMKLDWDSLRTEVMEHGVRNSLLMALMPTASTSQIMGNNECIEPFTSNIYLRRVLAGEFIVINKYLLRDLKNLGMWNKDMKTIIIYYKGSIQEIDDIPSTIRNLYKTTWDLKQKVIVDQAADRGPYICQTQSMNIHMPQPTRKDIQNLHFYSWKRGLKTGLYYLRTKGGKDAQQVTIDPKFQEKLRKKKQMQEHERKMSNTSALEGEENRALAEHISSFEGNKQEVCENCSA
jgi:ribonucleoside-diphosphate reductase alpha subunit